MQTLQSLAQAEALWSCRGGSKNTHGYHPESKFSRGIDGFIGNETQKEWEDYGNEMKVQCFLVPYKFHGCKYGFERLAGHKKRRDLGKSNHEALGIDVKSTIFK